MSNITPSKHASIVAIRAQMQDLDSGSNNATLVFYDDVKPASINTAVNPSAELVTLTFPDPALKDVTTDYVELNSTDAGTVIKAGTATWARLFNGNGVAVYDLEVGTHITVNNPAFILGSTFMARTVKFRPPV